MKYVETYREISFKGNTIFVKPLQTYIYDPIILGCLVSYRGKSQRMFAVAPNTWRGFHKYDKSDEGAGVVFKKYFIDNKERIIAVLKEISSERQLDVFEDSICKDIRDGLSNVKKEMLKSYNKIRKPVDLYIEHIVSMAAELEDHRIELSKYLFIPLDSQILQSQLIFEDRELLQYGLTRNCTFKDIYNKDTYRELQDILQRKSELISKHLGCRFDRIFFDLVWNERYSKEGNNLFQTNFK